MGTPAPHPDSASPDPDDSRELVATVRVDGEAARRLRRAATFQQRPVDDVAAYCVRDELDRDVYDVLYTNVDDYASTLDGLSQRLALLIRELGALPTGDAAKVIAQAAAEKGGHLPDPWHERMVEQLTSLWSGRGTFFDKRADGTFGPVEDIKIDVLVTPEQWDALGRIGAPGSLASGAQKAMAAGIAALDH
ncbi:hypothetical protein [Streptomyces sp. NPDC059631]|uniref:hypothetical protein n=1 Tax=unclassified Streptomyces TaxID=2593676 RepID=UPI0036AEC239